MGKLVGCERALGVWNEFEVAAIREGLFQKHMLCGSLRREQPFVHDVDIVAIPTLLEVEGPKVDLFEPPEIRLEMPLMAWAMEHADRQAPEGTAKTIVWAPKNPVKATDVGRKIVRFFLDGVEMDIYLAQDEQTFWPQVVVRTGPQRPEGGYGPDDPGAEQNRALAIRARACGLKLAMGGQGLTLLKTGEAVQCLSEQDFFRALKLPFCPAMYRDDPRWVALIQAPPKDDFPETWRP